MLFIMGIAIDLEALIWDQAPISQALCAHNQNPIATLPPMPQSKG